MNIFFVRHGETEKNREKRLQGRSDLPLNEKGVEQAGQVRDYFQREGFFFDEIWSSPLSRAVQTARIIVGEDRSIHLDDRLLEMDYGPYEGSSLEAPAPEIVHFFSDFVHNPAPEGMESLAGVVDRMGNFLEDLRQVKAENILVATHAIAMKGALEYLTPDSNGSWWSRYLSTCAVYRTSLADGAFTLPEEVLSTGYEPGV